MTQKIVDEMPADGAEADVAIERRGALARIVLKRSKALNALTTAMRAAILSAVPKLARDASLYAVSVRSENPRAFSAGGDVRELVSWHREDPAKARAAFAEEYLLNWTLECFSKPTVSLIDGIVMGSGVGISLYNTHRVAGEGYKFAMPETAIGLFPDVGVAHLLSRLPLELGTYLGLTGRTIGRSDAYALGLVTHCITADEFDGIEAALADAQTIDALLDGLHREPGASELMARGATISRCFSAPTVELIMERLSAVDGDDAAFARGIGDDLAKRSPTALKITLRHLRQSAGMSLRDVLAVDLRLAARCLEDHDFAEGVRAALIDKDNLAVWKPARLEDVTEARIAGYFAPLGEGEDLQLATRQEMQAARF